MSRSIDVLLLLALPASGKSELRRYLEHMPPAERLEQFGLGPTVQLDDFPYVHFMRLASHATRARGHAGLFFLSDALPMRECGDWGTLTLLLDEDYGSLLRGEAPPRDQVARWLFGRFDRARSRLGLAPPFASLEPTLLAALATELEPAARALADSLPHHHGPPPPGHTVVLEFARGGAAGSEMPLPAPYGYDYALSLLSPALLRAATVLYVWVTPEESRRKNHERTDPNDPGSILHHGVPPAVMWTDYGCDDMEWLVSRGPGSAIALEGPGGAFLLPVARFDNRKDLTTFLRGEPSAWPAENLRALREGLREAFAGVIDRR